MRNCGNFSAKMMRKRKTILRPRKHPDYHPLLRIAYLSPHLLFHINRSHCGLDTQSPRWNGNKSQSTDKATLYYTNFGRLLTSLL